MLDICTKVRYFTLLNEFLELGLEVLGILTELFGVIFKPLF